MRLLQILYPGIGGHSSVAFSLAEGDTNHTYDHLFLGYGIEEPSSNFIEKAQSLSKQFKTLRIGSGFKLKPYVQAYRSIKELQPSYIILHSTSLILVVWLYAKLNRINFLCVEHQSNDAKSRKDWIFTVLILLFGSKVVYLTNIYKEQINKKFALLSKWANIFVIPNGIALKSFEVAKDALKPNTSKLIISMVSRMNSLRDHKTLIDAFSLVRAKYPSQLKLAGDGQTKQELQAYALSLGLEDDVHFLGMIKEHEIMDLLNKTTIYVHSSLAETLSTSLLQVMATRTPIIATNIPGINNLLAHNEDAILFEPKSVQELFKAIMLLIENMEIGRELASAALVKLKENFTNEVMFKTYDLLIKNQLGN